MLALDKLQVVSVKDHFLDLFFRQHSWEERTVSQRVCRVHMLHRAGLAKRLCVGRHFFLENQEVHDLVEHCEWTRLLLPVAESCLRQHVCRLLRVNFKRLYAFSEHVDLLENSA